MGRASATTTRRALRPRLTHLLLIAPFSIAAIVVLLPFDVNATPVLGSRIDQLVLLLHNLRFQAALASLPIVLSSIMFRRMRPALLVLIPAAILGMPDVLRMAAVNESSPPQGPSTSKADSVLKVATANILFARQDYHRLQTWLQDEQPDIVFLQEWTESDSRTLATALAPLYPHQILLPRPDAFGQAILSKLPLAAAPSDTWFESLDTPQIQTAITFQGLTIDLLGVHLPPPLSLCAEHRSSCAALAAATAERCKRPDAAFLMAGDFNATPSSPILRLLQAPPLSLDSALDSGRGRQATWPTRFGSIPGAAIRIDHILGTSHLACLHAEVGPDIGSDHLPILSWWARRREARAEN